jgi:hypothetical protein
MGLLTQLVYSVNKPEKLERLCDADPHDEALVVISEVRAYWQLAYKRVIDNVPSAIDRAFLHGLSQDIQKALLEGLGLTSNDANDKARRYLAEDPRVTGDREELQAKLARLEDVWRQLVQFSA